MNRLKRLLKKSAAPQRGFTLLEMVVVLAIIALLMLIVIPNLNDQRKTASQRSDAALKQVVHNQAEMYANDTGNPINDVTLEKLRDGAYLNSNQYSRASTKQIKPVDSHAASK
ncbi:prepilin-type N-terminal cleavage/methylation domain-containing protein [Lactiplantibacillus garii]|uniref:Prepilin-type N-terminal cleavage/methylation domain-containing protein n=1 Tax=Lactiplantibacillus garii TaxID=2306423 RepID=A0A3R8J5L1_9LACO|nr:competence type IV pilus major pilin ComGC [Lactiplantibacillus garii]RRK09545.1 prepilin-type N-terminal cleavage/methylation domain-containing protein [Lactiplantibacillus garii]